MMWIKIDGLDRVEVVEASIIHRSYHKEEVVRMECKVDVMDAGSGVNNVTHGVTGGVSVAMQQSNQSDGAYISSNLFL